VTTFRPHRFQRPSAHREGALAAWLARRSFCGEAYDAGRLLAKKNATVSVVLPAREVAGTIERVVDELVPLRRLGLIDELTVVDAASADGTAERAAARGATVVQESELMPELGPAQGKGDAMWRGLAATNGDVVVYLDTDTENFHAGFLLGLLGPLFEDPEIKLVKGAFSRPFKVEGRSEPTGGGRVTELVARPLLNLYAPELGGFRQPLAGETSGRRELLEALSFPVGYGVEIAMLLDAHRLVGVDALAQVDLGERQNRHQPLRSLSAMAYVVLITGLRRALGPDALSEDVGALALPGPGPLEMREVVLAERPPLRELHDVRDWPAAAGLGATR
jgi:glucosyl-3-phosphoglycerate synthase